MTRVETSGSCTKPSPLSKGEKPSIVVLKFGGTSLGTPSRIGLAVARVKQQLRRGLLPVVVVSARGDTTDSILADLRSLCGGDDALPRGIRRETDRALATGETLSAALLAAALVSAGIRAESVCAGEAVLLADGPHGDATLTLLRPGRLARLIDNRSVPVVAGFQGIREDGELVTLGRGSSDITAVFLAAELSATGCHIVTDVEGVHEEDPRVVPDSPRYPTLTFDALVDITGRGATVVHPHAARTAHDASVPLHIYHYGAPIDDPSGTLVGDAR